MLSGRPPRPATGPRLLAAWLSLGVLAAPPAALAQGGGASTTNRPGVAQQGQGEQATPGPGPQSGQAAEGQPPRNQVEQQERATGVAPAPERREEQLRDLNELSRQLAPSNPVPAPGVGGDGARR